MKDIPIIFSGPMVRALLDGRKTMTRRLRWRDTKIGGKGNGRTIETPWARVKPSDRLWVRESVCHHYHGLQEPAYRADWADRAKEVASEPKWTPSIHMPRWASRLTLIVTATKIERLQNISEADAAEEGMFRLPDMPEHGGKSFGWSYQNGAPATHLCDTARDAFGLLWCLLHGEANWDDNPEVVALTFTVHKQNIDKLQKAVAA